MYIHKSIYNTIKGVAGKDEKISLNFMLRYVCIKKKIYLNIRLKIIYLIQRSIFNSYLNIYEYIQVLLQIRDIQIEI